MKESVDKVVESSPEEPKYVVRDLDGTTEGSQPLNFKKRFHFEYVSALEGKTLSGDFTAHRMTLGDYRRMAIRKAELTAGLFLGANVDGLTEMLAYLAVALEKTPEWWRPEEFYDGSIVQHVWEIVRNWEDSFRGGGMGK